MTSTAPPVTRPTTNVLSTLSAIHGTLTSFLTVAIHQILYLRSIYPRRSFLSCRAYNFPARQNRHPAVCKWILDAVAAIHDQLSKSTVSTVSVVIFSLATNEPLERYTFDVSGLPIVPEREVQTEIEGQQEGETEVKVNTTDLEAQFRAILSRLNAACARLKALPNGDECSFTVCIELRNDADAPVGLSRIEQAWVAAEPELGKGTNGEDGLEGKTIPVRRVEAGELRMEFWIEESKAKFAHARSNEHAGGPP